MAAHLSEEEQIEALKSWWKENGTSTLVAVAVFVAGFFGWNYYKDAKVASAQAASVQFQTLADGVQTLDAAGAVVSDEAEVDAQKATVLSAADTLIKEHDSTLYADFARFQKAKLAVEQNNYDEAVTILQQVKNSGANEESQQLASVRLARVLAAQGKYSEALREVQAVNAGSTYASLSEETKGDIYMMQQNLTAAAKAYQAALAALPQSDQQRRSLVQFKIDNTKVASSNEEHTPEDSLSNPHGGASKAAGDA